MSKIFRISGNYVSDKTGEWQTPDPSFMGEIVVDDHGQLHGYCNELYDHDIEENKVRYLAGHIAEHGDDNKKGICFLKLSNYEEQSPLMYTIPDLTDQERGGNWAAIVPPIPIFVPINDAWIDLTEEIVEDPEKEAQRIMDKYNEINLHVGWNEDMVSQVDCCFNVLLSMP